MKAKIRLLSTLLSLILIAGPLLPWAGLTVQAQDIQTFTIEDKQLYEELKSCLANRNTGALKTSDDEGQTLALNMEKIKLIRVRKADLGLLNSQSILETLFRGCQNLGRLSLEGCDLGEFDFSSLNNKESLTSLYLVSCKLEKIPDLMLPNLETICVSKNDLSADGACENLTKEKLPNLKRLWVDDCEIADISFVGNLGELEDLSVGDNRLTDDTITLLAALSSQNLSALRQLNLGKRVHVFEQASFVNLNSTNKFTDLAGLAALPTCFPLLQELDLTSLRITSLQEFVNIRNDVHIDFQKNKIDDFTGLKSNANFDLTRQDISLSGDFVAGRESELPELIKRILEADDMLAGTLSYENCSLSEDGTSIVIKPNVSQAYVTVESGKLRDSEINFKLKQIPKYTVPDNLTATVGDTLAEVCLPEGFSWKDPTLSVGEEGTNTFQAVYTPQNLDRYVIVEDIDIPVEVKAEVTNPPEPTEPTEPPKPTEPTEPTEPPKPTEPTEPSKPTEPTEPTEPTKPTEPSKPIDSKEQKKKELELNAQLKVKFKGRKIEISWGKVSGADGYDVYVQYCYKDFNAKSIKPIKNGNTTKLTVTKINGKRLDLKKVCKVYVRAYQLADGRKQTLAKTITAHVVGSKNKNYSNVKAVRLKKHSYTLKKGGTAAIKASTVLDSKRKKPLTNEHAKEFRYATTNKEVATVSKKGKIKAVGKGSCIIYVYARNGYAKAVKVNVK